MSAADRPSVIVATHPRSVDEVFDSPTFEALAARAAIVWARDEPMPADEFDEAIRDASGVVFGTWPGSRDIVRAAPKLRIGAEVLGSLRHPELDFGPFFERDIPIGTVAPAFGVVVAEMCLGLTLASLRSIAESDRAFRTGSERYLHAGSAGARSLIGATVGFVGCGSIARRLQDLLDPFAVEMLGYDPWLEPAALVARGVEPVDLPELFDRSDVVYVLAVPTPDNEGMVSRALLGRLGPDDLLVVGSRAHLVDFDALTDLVAAGKLRAGIDVFPEEPLRADHPLRAADGAVLTAHLAGALPSALHEIGRIVAADILSVLDDGTPNRLQFATPEMMTRLFPD